MVRRATAALFVVAVLAAPACSATDGSGTGRDAGAAEDETGLRATLQRATLFETRRALKLLVRNTGADDAELETVQLSSPLFEPVAPESRNASVSAGGRPVNIPLRFGAARCAGDDGSGEDTDAALVATVDGEERRIALEQRPADMLAEIHATECAAAGVLADVELRLGERWTPAGPRTLAGEISMSPRRRDVAADLDALLGNVIFAVAPAAAVADGEPWLTVADGQAAGPMPITIEAARCDPHALIEYKRTFIFVAVVAVDGGEPVRVDVEADGGARRALEALLASCIG